MQCSELRLASNQAPSAGSVMAGVERSRSTPPAEPRMGTGVQNWEVWMFDPAISPGKGFLIGPDRDKRI